jgi:hypothetical protein
MTDEGRRNPLAKFCERRCASTTSVSGRYICAYGDESVHDVPRKTLPLLARE